MTLKYTFLVVVGTVLVVLGCDRKPEEQRVNRRDGEPAVVGFDADDADMSAAITEARRTTDEFLRALAAPGASHSGFSVKRPFPTSEELGAEHIWISDVSYDGKLVHGVIANEPLDVPGVRLNDAVSFPPGEISDWMYFEDGKVVGGFTIRVVRKHMPADEAAEFDRRMQFKQ